MGGSEPQPSFNIFIIVRTRGRERPGTWELLWPGPSAQTRDNMRKVIGGAINSYSIMWSRDRYILKLISNVRLGAAVEAPSLWDSPSL